MTKEIKIHCDFCKKDLSTCDSGYVETYLCLNENMIPNISKIRYDMPLAGIIKDKHFCSKICLKSWLN